MRWLILLCFLICLVPAAHAYDCPPGTHFVPDGVFIGVWWTDPATGNTEFIVEEEGDCVSDCYPPNAECPKCREKISAIVRTWGKYETVAEYYHEKGSPKARRKRRCKMTFAEPLSPVDKILIMFGAGPILG